MLEFEVNLSDPQQIADFLSIGALEFQIGDKSIGALNVEGQGYSIDLFGYSFGWLPDETEPTLKVIENARPKLTTPFVVKVQPHSLDSLKSFLSAGGFALWIDSTRYASDEESFEGAQAVLRFFHKNWVFDRVEDRFGDATLVLKPQPTV